MSFDVLISKMMFSNDGILKNSTYNTGDLIFHMIRVYMSIFIKINGVANIKEFHTNVGTHGNYNGL